MAAELNDTDEELGVTVFRTVVRHCLIHGYLPNVEIKASNLNKIAKGVASLISEWNFDFLTDHTGGLLDDALAAQSEKRSEVAILLYATFIEHKINGIIDTLVRQKGLGGQVAIDLIRRMNMQQKLTSVLELLGAPPFEQAERQCIDSILNQRNEFAHYKWKSNDEEHSARLISTLNKCQEVVDKVNAYEDRHIFAGRREAVEELLRTSWNPLSRRLGRLLGSRMMEERLPPAIPD